MISEETKDYLKKMIKEHIQAAIINNPPTQSISAIIFSHGSELDFLPHSLGIFAYLITEYKENIESSSLPDSIKSSYIWNPAEYSNNDGTSEIEYCDETFVLPRKIIESLQEVQDLETRYDLALFILKEAIKEIKPWFIEMYKDFLSYNFCFGLTHFELHTFRENFKEINPELYDEFSAQLSYL